MRPNEFPRPMHGAERAAESATGVGAVDDERAAIRQVDEYSGRDGAKPTRQDAFVIVKRDEDVTPLKQRQLAA
jgi:hypothetical protein